MIDRREFLATGLGSAAAWSTLQANMFAAAAEPPLRVGLIGCGWYGKTDLLHLIQVAPVEVVGLCDVDKQMLVEAADLVATRQTSGAHPPTFADYRQFLKQQQPDIVLIDTPDHWHCLPMVDACRAGADVYVQKPISWDVVEGQAMVKAARKYDRTVQVGLQRRSTKHLLEARRRFIDSGVMGKIAYVDIHSYFGDRRGKRREIQPPEHLDWEAYVGPAPWVDYHPAIHPRGWRGIEQFGNGQMGDLCVHFFDLVRAFLNLGWPEKISASGGALQRSPDSVFNIPDTQTAVFEYPDVQIVWNQRNWGQNPDPQYPWGATLYGERGTLKLSVKSFDYAPRGKGEHVHGDYLDEREQFPEDLEYKPAEPFAAPATRAHLRDFLAARQEGKKPTANIVEGHISTASCLLANISMEVGRTLQWNGAAEQVVGDDEANARLQREYREPWVHPTPESVTAG
ncbi:MAG: Gfo/Idh/MocA family protein [Bythopirellula sp.]